MYIYIYVYYVRARRCRQPSQGDAVPVRLQPASGSDQGPPVVYLIYPFSYYIQLFILLHPCFARQFRLSGASAACIAVRSRRAAPRDNDNNNNNNNNDTNNDDNQNNYNNNDNNTYISGGGGATIQRNT